MRVKQWRGGLRIFCFGLLCLGVFMQVLGAPSSMWCMDPTEELIDAQILEDLSIPTWKHHDAFSPLRVSRSDLSYRVHDMIVEGLLFRPPCCFA